MEIAYEFVEWLDEKHPKVAQYFADYALRFENDEATVWDFLLPMAIGGFICWLMILISQWLS